MHYLLHLQRGCLHVSFILKTRLFAFICYIYNGVVCVYLLYLTRGCLHLSVILNTRLSAFICYMYNEVVCISQNNRNYKNKPSLFHKIYSLYNVKKRVCTCETISILIPRAYYLHKRTGRKKCP